MISIAALLISLLAQDPVWPGLEVGNWIYLWDSADGNTAMFVRQPEANRIWVRYEYRQDQPVRSERQLMEADCATGRIRTLQREGFALPNLMGGHASTPGDAWRYPAPDTFGETVFDLVCNPPPEGYTLR